MLKHRILIVDDDERLLRSFHRILSTKFNVLTANSALLGLECITGQDPFSIVISDYKMPGMNGVDFLAEVGRKAPDTVRILLTGYADLNVALDAVNEGNIFRMLQKPCPPKTMAKALVDGIKYYEMAASKRELMEKTIQESVAILGDLISLVKPEVYGRISRITPYVRLVCTQMDPPNIWEVVSATRLSMIGFITLPADIVQKDLMGVRLSPKEQRLFNEHPSFAASFIQKIPRLEEMARIIAYQEKRYDGEGVPEDSVMGAEIPLGARILKVCLDFDRLVSSGRSSGDALNALSSQEHWYDPDVIGYLFEILGGSPLYNERNVHLYELNPGMIVAKDIIATRGEHEVILLASGQELSEMAVAYLKRFANNYKVPDAFRIMEPKSDAE